MPERRILIVDDEESILKNLTAYFEDEGFVVETYPDAETALKNIDASMIDMAVIDMRLPGMDGNALIKKLYGLSPGIRCVIHTGSSDYVLPDELIALGIKKTDVFFKPVPDLSVLLKALMAKK